jgi:hypothetical protein
MTIEKQEPTILVRQTVNTISIEQIVQDNPDLSDELVRQLLIAQAEVNIGKVEPYQFE